MLHWPLRVPAKGSRRFPGGTLRLPSETAASISLSFLLAPDCISLGSRRTSSPAKIAAVALSAKDWIIVHTNTYRYYRQALLRQGSLRNTAPSTRNENGRGG